MQDALMRIAGSAAVTEMGRRSQFWHLACGNNINWTQIAAGHDVHVPGVAKVTDRVRNGMPVRDAQSAGGVPRSHR